MRTRTLLSAFGVMLLAVFSVVAQDKTWDPRCLGIPTSQERHGEAIRGRTKAEGRLAQAAEGSSGPAGMGDDER